MTVRRTQKAINTINSFVQYSKGTVEENRPRGQTVFLSLKPSLVSSLTVFWSGGVTESYIHLLQKAVVEEVSFSPRGISLTSLSDCKLHPVLWEGQQGRSRLSSSCWKPAALRSWWRSCWGKVPAFREVVLSTTRMHLTKRHDWIRVPFGADIWPGCPYITISREGSKAGHLAASLSCAHPLWWCR